MNIYIGQSAVNEARIALRIHQLLRENPTTRHRPKLTRRLLGIYEALGGELIQHVDMQS